MKLKYNFVLQEVAGTFIAVAVGDGARKFHGMMKLNESGKRIFELIQQEDDVDSVVKILSDEYEADPELLRSETEKILNCLRKENLLDE